MIELRKFQVEDYKYLKKWITNERICCQWSGRNFSYPLDDLQLARYMEILDRSNTNYAFTAISKESGFPIGHIKIGKIDYKKKAGALQFIIVGDKDYRGKGIGKKIIKQAIEYAFIYLGLQQLSLRVFSFNVAGIKCYEAVGFKKVSYSKQSFRFSDNEFWDRIEMVLEKEVWEKEGK